MKVTRSGEGTRLWISGAGGCGVLVVGTERPGVVELWDWTLGPGDRHGSEAHSAGSKELLQVHQGTISVEVEGQSVTLRAGDALAFPCRRWNWRQARRTQLREDTTTALFILDVLEPMTDVELRAAADDLVDHFRRLGCARRRRG